MFARVCHALQLFKRFTVGGVLQQLDALIGVERERAARNKSVELAHKALRIAVDFAHHIGLGIAFNKLMRIKPAVAAHRHSRIKPRHRQFAGGVLCGGAVD
jgi:hypothetical protein